MCQDIVQVANGLRIYFDKALQQLLLYAKEQDMAAKVRICQHCHGQVMIARHSICSRPDPS